MWLIVTLITLPFILISLACVILVVRADRQDLPKVAKHLAKCLGSRDTEGRPPALPGQPP